MSLEEKIIAYSDNLVKEDKVMDPGFVEERYKKKFGKNSKVSKRVLALNEFIGIQ